MNESTKPVRKLARLRCSRAGETNQNWRIGIRYANGNKRDTIAIEKYSVLAEVLLSVMMNTNTKDYRLNRLLGNQSSSAASERDRSIEAAASIHDYTADIVEER